MHHTYSAAAKVLHLSIAQFQAALRDVPDDSTDWIPAPGMSSFGVLVRHSVTGTRFFLETAAGREPSRDVYYREIRPPIFETREVPIATLIDELGALDAEIDPLFEAAGDAELTLPITWQDPLPERSLRNGADCLLHAVAHFREHVGHAEVMRDVWRASHA